VRLLKGARIEGVASVFGIARLGTRSAPGF